MHLLQSIASITHSAFFIIVGMLGIGFLIGFHELGHFLFCKLFNIRTPSFSIGMGPRILQKKIGETNFVLSAIPLGGYVEIAGSAEVGQGEQAEAKATDEGSFATRPYWQKFLVMFGGILFNLIFAYFAITLLYFLGMPKSPLLYPVNASQTISHVEADSPAKKAGLHEGQKITAVDGTPVSSTPKLVSYFKEHPGQTIKLTLEENGSTSTKSVLLESRELNNKQYGFLGLEFEVPRYGFIDSIKHGISGTNHLIAQVWNAFKGIFSKKQFNNLAGPIMVISQTIKGAERGFKVFLLLLAFISINLGVLNIIPLPIMDGGQILFYTIEAVIGRPLPEKIREYIHIATWIGVLILAVYLSVKDIGRLFWSK